MPKEAITARMMSEAFMMNVGEAVVGFDEW
jgi:hypothetical protein